MSRIGSMLLELPDGVKVVITDGRVLVEGKLGAVSVPLFDGFDMKMSEGRLSFVPKRSGRGVNAAIWGLQTALVRNAIKGVDSGFMKQLELNGVGYKAQMSKNILTLSLGFSHDVKVIVPEGMSVKCDTDTSITVQGSDKYMVGQFAANVRSYRPPEPYLGKGIKYKGEVILRKKGKK